MNLGKTLMRHIGGDDPKILGVGDTPHPPGFAPMFVRDVTSSGVRFSRTCRVSERSGLYVTGCTIGVKQAGCPINSEKQRSSVEGLSGYVYSGVCWLPSSSSRAELYV